MRYQVYPIPFKCWKTVQSQEVLLWYLPLDFCYQHPQTRRPFSTWSRRKWWHISICLVRDWNTRFMVRSIALMLSHMIGICCGLTSKSSSCFWATVFEHNNYQMRPIPPQHLTKQWKPIYFYANLLKSLKTYGKFHKYFCYPICNRKNQNRYNQPNYNRFPWNTKAHTYMYREGI